MCGLTTTRENFLFMSTEYFGVHMQMRRNAFKIAELSIFWSKKQATVKKEALSCGRVNILRVCTALIILNAISSVLSHSAYDYYHYY